MACLGASVYDQTDPVGRHCSTSWPWWPNSKPTSSDPALARDACREGQDHVRGTQPKLNPRQEAHLVELLSSGEYSTAEIGDLFGVARSTVYRAVAHSKKAQAGGRTATVKMFARVASTSGLSARATATRRPARTGHDTEQPASPIAEARAFSRTNRPPSRRPQTGH
jgi:DNA-binding CsgD family transcriptional regulator